MKKIIITIGFIGILIFTIFRVEIFPYGSPLKFSLNPNTSIYVYKKNLNIKNKNDYISFLKNNTEKYNLEIFEDSNNNINWDKVYESITIDNILWRKCYILDYTPEDCFKYLLKITSNGNIYEYAKCGK